jgi:hypothetical protein
MDGYFKYNSCSVIGSRYSRCDWNRSIPDDIESTLSPFSPPRDSTIREECATCGG